MRIIVFVIGAFFVVNLIWRFSGDSEDSTTTPVPKDAPTDIYIASDLDEPRKKILSKLRGDDYNPFGYRVYTNKTERDEFGNEKKVKQYRSKLIIVSEGYYNEIKKFNRTSDIYINPKSALQTMEAPGTEKGYKLYLELLKCEDSKDYPYMFATSGNEKCIVNIPSDY